VHDAAVIAFSNLLSYSLRCNAVTKAVKAKNGKKKATEARDGEKPSATVAFYIDLHRYIDIWE
jgi:hypothetical protein